MSTTVIRYSESFKLQVVRDLEGGRFANIGQAASHYGIKGSVTIRGWLIKFGKDRLMPRVVRVETPDEQHELKRLRQRVRQLEGLLADKELGLVISETYLELACERAGILDVEDFKKRSLGVRAERGLAARAKSEGDVRGLGYEPAKLLPAEAAAATPGTARRSGAGLDQGRAASATQAGSTQVASSDEGTTVCFYPRSGPVSGLA